MREMDILRTFPRIKRTVEPDWRGEENKKIAKRYDKEFFDGDRVNGYGGYYYDGRWQKVVLTLRELYNIDESSAVLDIGCAKGFLLYDLQKIIPGIKAVGLDISEYALNHAMDGFAKYLIDSGVEEQEAGQLEEKARNQVLPFMIRGSAENLPWPDKSFDVVLAINTIHNLPREKCKKAIQEMNRVGRDKKKMFIQVDAYSNEVEKERMKNWVLTAETMMHVDEWIRFYKEAEYEGDYFWTIV